jgi:cytochrome c-type biogenesis protein CcmH
MFWILVILLLMIAAAILSFRLWRKPLPPAMEEAVDALNVLRDQRNELDAEVAAGRISEVERAARIADLTRRVHDEGLTAPATPGTRAAAANPKMRLWLAAAVTILVPVIAIPVYLQVGTPAALDPAARAPAAANSPHGDFSPEQMRAMLNKLKARLEAKPDDVTGWTMLGRGLQLVDDFAGSAAAFEKAAALRPDDASLLADYADSLAMSRQRDLTGKPWELIQQALRIDPKSPKALALAASAEFAQRRFESAKGYWQRLLAVIPPDSEDANDIRTMIAQIDGKSAGVAPPATAPAALPGAAVPGAASATAGKEVTGTVKLAPALAAKVGPDDVVFIFARAPDGSRMPLAIMRLKASELPKQFRLDDTQAMSSGRTLSSMPQVRIEARVSKSGDARPAPGDLRGESALVAPGAANVEIVINEEITGAPGSAAAGAPPAPAVSPPAMAASTPAGATAAGKQITGVVRLAPSLTAQVAPDDTLFIFARAAEGPRMPLAILRLKASELPRQFRLDDSLGMAGGPALSSVPQVRIEARISKSGVALPKSGDLRGESGIVAPGASNVEVVINSAVP